MFSKFEQNLRLCSGFYGYKETLEGYFQDGTKDSQSTALIKNFPLSNLKAAISQNEILITTEFYNKTSSLKYILIFNEHEVVIDYFLNCWRLDVVDGYNHLHHYRLTISANKLVSAKKNTTWIKNGINIDLDKPVDEYMQETILEFIASRIEQLLPQPAKHSEPPSPRGLFFKSKPYQENKSIPGICP
jgi:hypothetical protein